MDPPFADVTLNGGSAPAHAWLAASKPTRFVRVTHYGITSITRDAVFTKILIRAAHAAWPRVVKPRPDRKVKMKKFGIDVSCWGVSSAIFVYSRTNIRKILWSTTVGESPVGAYIVTLTVKNLNHFRCLLR